MKSDHIGLCLLIANPMRQVENHWLFDKEFISKKGASTVFVFVPGNDKLAYRPSAVAPKSG